MKRILCCGLMAGAIMFLQAPANGQGIMDDPTISQMQDQDIDANQELLDALLRLAEKGPIFKISPESIAIEMVAGSRGAASVRITNAGDQDGHIRGVNVIGSIAGMEMSSTCQEILAKGDFCEISLTYRSSRPSDVNTAIIGTINERGRTNFEVPVLISVREAPKAEPVVTPVVVQPPPEPTGRSLETLPGTTSGS